LCRPSSVGNLAGNLLRKVVTRRAPYIARLSSALTGAWMMFVGKYRINRHAARRMAQRNLGPGDLAAVLCLGRTERRAGAKFFFLGGRDVPEHLGSALERLVGTTAVV